MKIINLKAENIKKIKAVEYSPTEHVNIIGGNNEQGKTSVLDSIVIAIGGRVSKDTEPLRKGTKSGNVVVKTEDFTITRNLTQKGSTLTITSNKNRSKYPSPQEMLNRFFSKLTFDPLAFSNMEPRHQVDTLKRLVGLDFTELDKKRKGLFDERTIINRQVKDVRANVEAIEVPEGTPDKEVSILQLTSVLDEKRQANAEKASLLESMERAEKEVGVLGEDILELERRIKEKRNRIDEIGKAMIDSRSEYGAMPVHDLDEIISQITNAESTNVLVREKQRKQYLEENLSLLVEESRGYTGLIDDLDSEKKNELAKAKFPIEHLAFDEDGVLYKDIPFGQCSSAETLRVSLSMGMALNPELRVLLVKDGSLLDSDNLNVIRDMAKKNDYQIWIERVGDQDADCSIILEDGMIKEAK